MEQPPVENTPAQPTPAPPDASGKGQPDLPRSRTARAAFSAPEPTEPTGARRRRRDAAQPAPSVLFQSPSTGEVTGTAGRATASEGGGSGRGSGPRKVTGKKAARSARAEQPALSAPAQRGPAADHPTPAATTTGTGTPAGPAAPTGTGTPAGAAPSNDPTTPPDRSTTAGLATPGGTAPDDSGSAADDKAADDKAAATATGATAQRPRKGAKKAAPAKKAASAAKRAASVQEAATARATETVPESTAGSTEPAKKTRRAPRKTAASRVEAAAGTVTPPVDIPAPRTTAVQSTTTAATAATETTGTSEEPTPEPGAPQAVAVQRAESTATDAGSEVISVEPTSADISGGTAGRQLAQPRTAGPARWAAVAADPVHAPELLALAAVDTFGPRAKAWLRATREAYPAADADGLARLAVRRFVRAAGVGSAVAAAAGWFAPVVAMTAQGWANAELVLHVAAAYGHDPLDRARAVDLLVLTRLYPSDEEAQAGLAAAGNPPAGVAAGAEPAAEAVWRLAVPLAAQTGGWLAARMVARALPGATAQIAAFTGRASAEQLASRAVAHYRQTQRQLPGTAD